MPERGASRVRRGSRRGLASAALGLLGLGFVPVPSERAFASPEGGDGQALVMQYLDERGRLLEAQANEARSQARGHAWLAYRAARRKRLSFVGEAEQRDERARAAEHAARLLGRSLEELGRLDHERGLVQAERAELAARLQAARASTAKPVQAGNPQAPDPQPDEPPRFSWPVTGTVVMGPGIRADGMTGVELRHLGVQILSRINAQVLAPAPGTVARAEALAEGGYALVLEHGQGYTSILSGLRQVLVTPGQAVASGEAVGRVGRTLDGAPVVRFALYQGLDAQDPRRLVLRPGKRPVMRR